MVTRRKILKITSCEVKDLWNIKIEDHFWKENGKYLGGTKESNLFFVWQVILSSVW